MTHPALTAEQREARIERDIAACRRFAAVYRQAAIDYDQSAKRELARIAELEQLLADLDSKQVTPRQIERYPVVKRDGPYKPEGPFAPKTGPYDDKSGYPTATGMVSVYEGPPAPEGKQWVPCPGCKGTGSWAVMPCGDCDGTGLEEAAGETLLTVPMGGEVGK